jgi:AcrR family transcriptional regulator
MTPPPPSPGPATTPRKRGRGADPDQTRQALVAAAFETLRHDGFRGATARAIAERAHCNQATIYYHFGGIPPLLIEALRSSSTGRLDRYQEALAGLTDAGAVLAALDELHREDVASGHLTVMVELVGGITAEPALRVGIETCIQAWLDFVSERIATTLAGTPLGPLVPVAELTDLIFSLVIGLEMRTKLDGDETRFTRIANLAQLVAAMLPGLVPPIPPSGVARPSS